jgi:hypothetical protein
VLCALSPHLLDVRIAEPRSSSHHSAVGMGILSAHCLLRMGIRCARAVSALPLVCSVEAAPHGHLAQLFFNAWTTSR